MFKYITGIFIALPLLLQAQTITLSKRTEIHGHRGFRGHFPENTLTAFREAAKLGVDAVELDVVISKDSQVVVSHEPWFNYKICTEPTGEKVKALKQHNLYKLTYAEIRTYDCGKRGNSEFPLQQAIPEHKPLLSETIEQIDQYCRDNNLPMVTYNIEIKSGKIGDGKWHPEPQRIAELLHRVLEQYGISGRILVQSFDVRSLQAMHKLEPELRIGLLIANTGSVDHNIRKLGFTPYMYNPALKLTKEHTVKQAHQHGCKIIPWTVNQEDDMKRLIEWGVDGLITDYPDVALRLRKS
jgi:glycerophosphoryl diester phosphodiesterase